MAMPSYTIEQMEKWSNDPRTRELHHKIHRLRVELEIRTRMIVDPPLIPDRWRNFAYRQAFCDGYEVAWRNKPFSQPYTSARHQQAYHAGYVQGERESLAEIGRQPE